MPNTNSETVRHANMDLIIALAWRSCGDETTTSYLAFCVEAAERLGFMAPEAEWLDRMDVERWVEIVNVLAK